MPQILGSSVSYRIAAGPQQGRKAFMIRTIRPLDRPDPALERVAKANGFSLHVGVSCEGHQKDKRERLCRYIARPAVAVPRLSLSSTGKVLYTLNTPYRDGTTQAALDRGGHPPVDFIARLAALARGRSDPNLGPTSPATMAFLLGAAIRIDIEVCSRCGGSVRVIACIEDEDIIDRILAHLCEKEQNILTLPLLVPPTRAPPGALPLFAGKGAR